MNPYPNLPYTGDTTQAYPEVENWCVNYIGDWGEEWAKLGDDVTAQIVFPNYCSTYYFRTEQQLLMFELRWA